MPSALRMKKVSRHADEYNASTCRVCNQATGITDSRPSTRYGFTTISRKRTCRTCGASHRTVEISDDHYKRLRLYHDRLEIIAVILRGALDSLKGT